MFGGVESLVKFEWASSCTQLLHDQEQHKFNIHCTERDFGSGWRGILVSQVQSRLIFRDKRGSFSPG
jgi:hypothetical protein